MSIESEIHKACAKYLTKRQQGHFMGKVREALAAAKPEYDRVLIAQMLEEYARHRLCDMDLIHLETSMRTQAQLLRAADEANAAGVHTAKREEPYPPTGHGA